MNNQAFLTSIPDDFWQMIDEAAGDPGKFRELLGGLTRPRIIRFYWTYEELANHLRTERFLPFVHPDLSEDGVAELSNWVVAQGKSYYENILNNPVQIPPKMDDAGFLSELVEEFEEKYGDDLPINTRYWNYRWKETGKKGPWD